MTYPSTTLPQLLEQTAARRPGAAALIYFGATISYGQLQDHVIRIAAGLQAMGVGKGDCVALMMPNCPQFVISYFGALRAGAIVTATSSMSFEFFSNIALPTILPILPKPLIPTLTAISTALPFFVLFLRNHNA